MNLYDHEIEIRELGLDVPRWIAQDIDTAQVAAIVEGGCASGAYMPAVTHHEALATMTEHGDDVFDFLDGACGLIPEPVWRQRLSWSALACFYLSLAVEDWASTTAHQVVEALEDQDA
jgi:hypothetical protein